MTRTHVILEGLDDPALGQALSARWAAAGFRNAVDVAGQCAWSTPMGEDWAAEADGAPLSDESHASALTEAESDRAAAIARAFGVEPRDRVGRSFDPANDLADLRAAMTREAKARFATALMFGLPALLLHQLGPALAGGGGAAKPMALPWLIELLLVGWTCLAAGWPWLWQGGIALIHLRATSGLLVAVVLLGAFLPSAYGVVSLLWTADPWFGSPGDGGGPMFHAATWAVLLAAAQRWQLCRRVERLAGRADWMPRGYSRFVAFWLAAMAAALWLFDWPTALALGLIVPSVAPFGAVNPWSPGWVNLLPVIGFAGFFLFAPQSMDPSTQGVRIEIAAAFCTLLTFTYALGWSRLSVAAAEQSNAEGFD